MTNVPLSLQHTLFKFVVTPADVYTHVVPEGTLSAVLTNVPLSPTTRCVPLGP